MQYFSKILGSSSSFPYSIGESVPSHDPAELWTLSRGSHKEIGDEALIFSFHPGKSRLALSYGGSAADLAKNGLQKLKTLRHPDILKFLCAEEASDGTILVATEPATPLAQILADQRRGLDREAIQWGLLTISRALGFMHQSALIHGRLSAMAIFVTPGGDWKLGALEAVTPHAHIARYRDVSMIQPERYRSPEVARGNWDIVQSAPAHALDSWALGCVIYEIHTGSFSAPDQLRDTSSIPKEILPAYQKLLSSAPVGRAPAGELQNFPYLTKSRFVDLNMFLESLAIKDSLEKEAFLKRLPSQMDSLPRSFCTHKILPLVSTTMELGGGVAAFGCIVKMKDIMTDEEFKKRIGESFALKWYGNMTPDRALRIELINNLEKFIPCFDEKAINNSVFPAMCSGFQDMQSPAIRDASVKAILHLAPKLNDKNLNSVLMSHFAKLQVDPEGAIRTNTTVCIGRLANSLNSSARQKVLAPAFVRSLKDPFPPARAAGLVGLIASDSFFDPRDIATRILPAVAPLLIDPDGEVRAQAFKCLNAFIPRLTQFSTVLERQAEEARLKSSNEGKRAEVSSATSNGAGSGGWTIGGLGGSLSSLTTSFMGSKAASSAASPSSAPTGISSVDAANILAQASSHPKGESHTSSGEASGSATSDSFGVTAVATQPPPVDDDFDADDGTGWGEIDVKISQPSTVVAPAAPRQSMALGAPAVMAPSASTGSLASGGSAESEDLWSLPPPTVTRTTPKTVHPPVATPRSRSAKNEGDDWESLLGGSSTNNLKARKPPSRLGAVRR
uniref:Protein kinase domain-containing protein n=1 Tax=Compsopogon caeruleus TaxID=31354 RepID=A0A7S1TAK6_9RHOD|mmetsp:Transcript_14631/g.29812  ORF Transcript_14631/g.29812 Transcript_14631/m.29812 type:complete len:790 (+) Transcript_14631:116-2485(+)|eukprot:CAMPEP_0184682716 /NCGR_PEP_ID=MMETSP0312-20130426/8475_1 /TAXON_ID=31354 /ORGANISM="Compsopogon coeruleus, Strain SAG 36.94" /LENGTH=789 /DNA_ID=CAMNT_0027134567 /DNA_START=108 /DNA_END=2480 /DNA_ORIENTATION=+